MKTARRLLTFPNAVAAIFLTLCLIVTVVYGSASRNLVSSSNDPEQARVAGAAATIQEPWWQMRAVTASDTALTSVTRTWTVISAKASQIPPTWNTVSIAFYAYGDGSGGGDPNVGTFSWRLYGCRKYGPAQLLAYGTGAVGEMILSNEPTSGTALTLTNEDYKWVERPVLTSTVWPTDVSVSGTSDDVGTIDLDPLGVWGLYVEITSLSGITTLYPVITGR